MTLRGFQTLREPYLAGVRAADAREEALLGLLPPLVLPSPYPVAVGRRSEVTLCVRSEVTASAL